MDKNGIAENFIIKTSKIHNPSSQLNLHLNFSKWLNKLCKLKIVIN